MTPRPDDRSSHHSHPSHPKVDLPVPTASTPVRVGSLAITPRVLIVDGDHRVRDSLADLIGLADGVEVVGATSQLRETLDAVDRLEPGVVVIDPYLPDLASGLGLIGTLRASGRNLRIVATCREDGLHDLALRAGADACVDHCGDPAAFQEAVLAAARPTSVRARVGDTPRPAGRPAHPGRFARRASDTPR
jgi:DNA-binding NarL/FixJ family response regulator